MLARAPVSVARSAPRSVSSFSSFKNNGHSGSSKTSSNTVSKRSMTTSGHQLAFAKPAGFGFSGLAALGVAGAIAALFASGESNEREEEQGIFSSLLGFSLVQTASAASVPAYGVPGTKKERTFIAIKPDGVSRSLIGEIIARFEKKGYKLVALKLVSPTKEFAEQHYADLSKRPFFPGLVKYFSSGPVVAMVWEGKDVISSGRKIIGATNPTDAVPGSIRGDYCIQVGRNIIHGSDGPESAQHEISLWFTEKEISDWDNVLEKWIHEAN